ncbi:MAG: 50S ribosomal protein L10 [Acidobacteria bacterium]|nr:50S ribosomal protein L10 [Acidobacteriota bacterium]
MAKKRSQKETETERLHKELLGVSSVVLTTFSGLTVEQETDLRRVVQASGGKYHVIKNTLAHRAAQGTPAEALLKALKGVNSIAYTAGDPITLAKVLTKYAKDNPAFSFRAGLVEGRVVSLDQIQALAALPTREELLARLLYLLQAPAQRLATAVSAVGRNLAIVLNQAREEKKFSEGTTPAPEAN